MSRVNYSAVTTHESDLDNLIAEINQDQDKIVAVTQHGNFYTIFYERNGNEKEGADNG